MSLQPDAVELAVDDFPGGTLDERRLVRRKLAELAIRAALAQAGLAPADVGYVNLHGTATPKNDEMESHVIGRVFGDATPCASTKALIGHTLGAAGRLPAFPGRCPIPRPDATATPTSGSIRSVRRGFSGLGSSCRSAS